MARRNSIASATRNTAEGVDTSRRVLADVLLLERPARLDWIQIRRVRREVKDANASSTARNDDSLIVVRGEIVHHENVATTELREQLPLEPVDEAIRVGRGEHRALLHPPASSNCADQRQVLSPGHGDSLDVLGATLHPSVGPRHSTVEPRLVHEDEPLDVDPLHLADERRAFLDDVGAELFERASPLFFTTKPLR